MTKWSQNNWHLLSLIDDFRIGPMPSLGSIKIIWLCVWYNIPGILYHARPAFLEIRLIELTRTATVLAAPCCGANAFKPSVYLHACTPIPAGVVIAVAHIWIGATAKKFSLKKEEQAPRKPKTRKRKNPSKTIKLMSLLSLKPLAEVEVRLCNF